jgi:hypothetical protein
VWCGLDEGARDLEVLYLLLGPCFINPAFTYRQLRHLPREACPTPCASTGGSESDPERAAGVSRRHSTVSAGEASEALQGRKAEHRIGGAATRAREGRNRREKWTDGGGMGSRPDQQLGLPLEVEGELFHAKTGTGTSAETEQVTE